MSKSFRDVPQSLPSQDKIRARAYEIAMSRGFQPGHDLDDWLQAEYELMQLPIRKIVEIRPPKAAKPSSTCQSIVTRVRSVLF